MDRQLRENIAELLGTCGAIHLALPDKKSAQALDRREKADRLIALITMQLNPGNEIDRNMIALLPCLVKNAEKEGDDYRAVEKNFVRHAQFLLKEEWEKSEAMGPLLSMVTFRRGERQKRAYDYMDFWKPLTGENQRFTKA